MKKILALILAISLPVNAFAAWPSDSVRTKNWGSEVLTDADLEAQLDIIHSYIQDMMNSTSGHKHDGTANEGPKILVSDLSLTSGALGDTLYHDGSNLVRLAGNTTTTRKFYTQTGDGAASAAPSLETIRAQDLPNGSVLQVVNTQSGTYSAGSTSIPFDNSIPQNTEGDQVMSLSITPTSATSKLKIDVVVNAGSDNYLIAALFQDSTANALASGWSYGATNQSHNIKFTHYMGAGTTSSTTFKVRIGGSSGGALFNGGDGGARFGGVSASSITITEIKA